MPYVIRKRIKELYNRPLVLEVVLDNDKLSKHYDLDSGISKIIRGTVSLLVDANNCVICFINKNYEFPVKSKGTYTGSGDCVYDRRLTLPKELINDYAIDANMGIELILNEIVYRGSGTEEPKKIFSMKMEQGSMDFEPKELSGIELASSELLITTKFTNDFYINLVSEINNAFRIRLFTATMVLIRKLFENLLVDLLRQRYVSDPSKIELFFSTKKHRYRSFSWLIDSLKTNLIDFEPYDPSVRKDKGFIEFLEDIREKGNESAHTLEILPDPNKINALKPSINKYSDLIIRVTSRIKETQT